MLRTALLVVGLGLPACAPSLPSDDHPDAPASNDDAPPGGATLKLEMQLDNELPAQLDVDIRLEKVYLSATLVRAIADAGDASLTNCEMKWDSEDKPDPFTFTSPPIGTYSTIDLRVAKRESGSDPKAYQIEGKFRGTDFKIIGVDATLTASPRVALTLKPRMTQTVKIEISLTQMLQQITWADLPKKNGDYYLDDDDPQMVGVKYNIAIGFHSL